MTEMDIVQDGSVVETATATRARQRDLPATCYACGAPVQGPYCYQCGQKNDDCRRSILSLLYESVFEIITFDGRVLRTARSVLFRPGRHVREYGDGKRSPYSPPVRFFLVISFIFFTTLWVTETHLLTFRPDVEFDEAGESSISFSGGVLKSPESEPYTTEERQAILEMIQDDDDQEDDGEITINGETISQGRLFDRLLSIAENPNGFNNALNDWIPRIMIVMIPLLALLGALIIRGKNALIYDHLLVSLNTHTVAFIILIAGLIMPSAFSGPVFGWIFFVGVPVYYVLALKGAFGRGWFKTLTTSFIAWFVYAITITIALSGAMVASFTASI